MGKINSRSKGQRAEREVVHLLQPIVDRITEARELPYLDIERNQNQSNSGGYDLVGLNWLAIEVKHQEVLSVDTWWAQARRQAKVGQIPVLVYKKNRVAFRVRTWGNGFGNPDKIYVVDISLEDFLDLFDSWCKLKLI